MKKQRHAVGSLMKAISFFLVIVTVEANAQQFDFEFSVVGPGGGVTPFGPDTLFLTVGQPFAGESPVDTNNNASGFLYQYSGGPISPYIGTYSLSDGWNMVSVPRTLSDYSKTMIFPSAVSSAFAYEGSYVLKPILANGIGYWLKFNGTQSVTMVGTKRDKDTVNVRQGWNMIGSVSHSNPVTSITSIPAGIVTSNFFGYQGSYQNSSTIEPGQAYWVKVDQPGQLIFSGSVAAVSIAQIRIVPTTELPPPSPERENAMPTQQIPTELALGQNYPNPFNPTTVIHYQLPFTGRVRLKIFNTLGQEVKTLVDGVEEAGYKSAEWNASDAASGIYFYRIEVEQIGGDRTFIENKKMILIK